MKNLQEVEMTFLLLLKNMIAPCQMSLDVNLTGTFMVTQAVGKVMKLQGKGAIINIASDVAVVSPKSKNLRTG